MKRIAAATVLLASLVMPPPAGAQSVTVEALVLAEDRRASQPGDYELLAGAASHRDPLMRARAVRALGRLEQRHPSDAAPTQIIERALRDDDAHVRRTAAWALAQSMNARDAAAKAPARAALIAHLAREKDDAVASAVLESAARLADAGTAAEVEAAVLAQASTAARASGAAYALEVLSRRAGKPGVMSPAAIEWLRSAVFAPAVSPAAQRAAMQALATARAIDEPFQARASESPDFQIRRLAIAGGPLSAATERALRDADAHVRYEAVRAAARRGQEGCPALVAAVKDPDAHVALAAIDALGRCTDPGVVSMLAGLAALPGGVNWHRASHALVSLAMADAVRAREVIEKHAADAAWPVRMYAAAAAARIKDDATLVTLASDKHTNVREAAIAGLVQRAKEPADQAASRDRLKTAILSALGERRDPQLLRTAAGAVAAAGDPAAFRSALRTALDRLDEARVDTAVDARVAIVEALKLAAPGETLPPAPRERELMTPALQELRQLPQRARIEMARGGAFELELLPGDAPATVARFARLARAGYFDGLTFHRVVPNFVVQGGSPWANEYAGAPRFQRDEVGGARHDRGAVGISTRGRDTGDAQIFIDLVDLPRLTHDYTVFARVVSGMEVVDGILEADVIQRISILK